jgi:hypothetical protein
VTDSCEHGNEPLGPMLREVSRSVSQSVSMSSFMLLLTPSNMNMRIGVNGHIAFCDKSRFYAIYWSFNISSIFLTDIRMCLCHCHLSKFSQYHSQLL